jgi:hypothetical protein
MTLTDEQLNIAARRLCKLYGVDEKYFMATALKQVNAYRQEIGQSIAYAIEQTKVPHE